MATSTPVDLILTIDNVDDLVDAHDDITVTGSEQTITFDVLDNDEALDGATVTAIDGQAILAGQTIALASGDGDVTLNADGTFTFTPSAGASGTIQFNYTATDTDGDSDTATVHITVANPIVDDVSTTLEDTTVTIDVLSNDPVSAILPATITNLSVTDGTNGTTTVNSDATIDYTPAGDFEGVDSFTYSVTGLAAGLQYQFFDGSSTDRSVDDIAELDPDFVGITNNFDSEALATSLTGSGIDYGCLLYTSPSPRDQRGARMPSSA